MHRSAYVTNKFVEIPFESRAYRLRANPRTIGYKYAAILPPCIFTYKPHSISPTTAMAAMARSSLLLVAALIVSALFSHAAGIYTIDPVRPDIDATTGDGDGTKVSACISLLLMNTRCISY